MFGALYGVESTRSTRSTPVVEKSVDLTLFLGPELIPIELVERVDSRPPIGSVVRSLGSRHDYFYRVVRYHYAGFAAEWLDDPRTTISFLYRSESKNWARVSEQEVNLSETRRLEVPTNPALK
jgi:hypothetical protein